MPCMTVVMMSVKCMLNYVSFCHLRLFHIHPHVFCGNKNGRMVGCLEVCSNEILKCSIGHFRCLQLFFFIAVPTMEIFFVSAVALFICGIYDELFPCDMNHLVSHRAS